MSYNNNSSIKYLKEGEVIDGEEAELLIGDPNEENEYLSNKDKEVRDEQGRRRFHGAFTGGYSAGYYNTVGSREGWAPSDYKSTKANRRAKDSNERKILDFMDDEDLESFNPVRNIVKESKIRIESKRSSKNNKKEEIEERYGPDGSWISNKPAIAVRYDDSKDDAYERKASQSMFSHLHSSNKTVDEYSMRGGIGTGVLDNDYDDIDVYAQPAMSTYSIKSKKNKNLTKDDGDGDRIVLGKKKRPPPPQIEHYSPPKIMAPPPKQEPVPSENAEISRIAFVPKSKRIKPPQPQPKPQSLSSHQSEAKSHILYSSDTVSTNYTKSDIIKIIERYAIPPQEAKSALRGFQPFAEDPQKQERYKNYLKYHSKPIGSTKDESDENLITFPSNYNIEQITKQIEEFYKSSKVFKPMNTIVSEKFVSASNKDPNAKPEVKQTPEQLNMFGALTRSRDTFFPERLLCKRFGVDMPDLSQSFKRGQVQEVLSSSDVDRLLRRTRAAPQLVKFEEKYIKKEKGQNDAGDRYTKKEEEITISSENTKKEENTVSSEGSRRRVRRNFELEEPDDE